MKRIVNPVKGVLSEELDSALRKLVSFRNSLSLIPRGSLVEKKIKGRSYYYLAYREKGKVKFEYKGKLSPEERGKYREAREKRARYRVIISALKRQEAYLKRVLHERKRRSY